MAKRTIHVDNPWHKTQSFGRISTQALERKGTGPQLPGQKTQDSFLAQAILHLNRGPWGGVLTLTRGGQAIGQGASRPHGEATQPDQVTGACRGISLPQYGWLLLSQSLPPGYVPKSGLAKAL